MAANIINDGKSHQYFLIKLIEAKLIIIIMNLTFSYSNGLTKTLTLNSSVDLLFKSFSKPLGLPIK